MREQALKRLIIDWLDDNYHFGEATEKIGPDEDASFLKNGILDSLGFVKLIIFIEQTCKVTLNRRDISPANFDSLSRIVKYVLALPEVTIPG
jgi:acyl carrier protein